MKIVILAGGTGSIALQTGLYNLIDKSIEGVETKIIVNAYDNGLSTGAVRKVLGGNILGPSDVRKNQTTRYKLSGGHQAVMDFLDIRFTCEANKAREFCHSQLKQLLQTAPGHVERRLDVLFTAVDKYFSAPASTQIDYNDFSLANIIYAGLAAMNGNSIRAAATIMADVLGIQDNVLVNDDTSLFLGAITKSGKRISDEGDIVSWNNPSDPIVDVFFIDAKGHETIPVLNKESEDAIMQADLIIMSSGTQWSSLIPTYASLGFKKAITETNAKIIMVMNRAPDKDAPEQSASDIIKTLVPKYFPVGKIDVVIDSEGHQLMRSLNGEATSLVKSASYSDLGSNQFSIGASLTKHNAVALAKTILKVYFTDYMGAKAIVMDYDDTIAGRGNTFPKASNFNKRQIFNIKLDKYICTGNSIKAINLPTVDALVDRDVLPITVFADGGINEYWFDPCSTVDEDDRRFHFVKCIDENAKFDDAGPNSIPDIISRLCAAGIPAAKIDNRGDVMVSIKPIDPEYRQLVVNLVKTIAVGFEVKATGRTTIEINKKEVSKDVAVEYVLKKIYKGGTLVYIGDELKHGNDSPVRKLAETNPNIKCLEVRSPVDTALFLIALNS